MKKNKLLILSALSLPVISYGGAYSVINANANNENLINEIQTMATINISNYRVENVTDEGFDFIIKFNTTETLTGVNLPYWKYGNYNGRVTNTSAVKIGDNEFKAHFKMKDIGSGTEYINLGIHPITSEGSVFVTDINVKLDTTIPNLTLSLSNTNWTNKDISVSSISNDNQNIIENIYFYDKNNNQTKTALFSNPNILLIKHPSGSIMSNTISNRANITTVEPASITSVSQLKGYDIVIYDGHAWGVTNGIDTYLNQAFEQGVSIITNMNDDVGSLAIASSGYGNLSATYTLKSYTNGYGGGGGGRVNRFAYLMDNQNETDNHHYIKPRTGAFLISNSTYSDGTISPAVLMMTHSNGNKWIHSQTAGLFTSSGSLYRAIDEIMSGTMKTRQTYENSFTVSENGTYSVEVEDFSGNKTKKAIAVSNIDKVLPTINISGNPTSWSQSATLTITGSDDLSGVKEIVLPNGTIVSGSTTNYTVGTNGDYTFKIRDKAGNEISQTISVTKVDGTVGNINKVKSTMTHLDESTSSRRITMTFSAVADNLSGLKGYSYVIDNSPSTIPDNIVDTTSTTITKDITDTGKYYLHIKAIDNVGNAGNTKHYEIEVPSLINTINSSGTIDLKWSMNATDQPYIYSVFRKRGDESKYSALGNSKLRERVNVLNIHPNVGNAISYTTWDGETITDVKSSSLKQWMEQPNAENTKGYGMGIIEVIPLSIDDFNTNPNTYLYKATSGVNKDKYVTNIRGKEEVIDVVMFGTWDSNGSKDISSSGVTNIKSFLNDNGAVLFGHDTLHINKNFWQFAPYADVKAQNPTSENGSSIVVGGTHVQANREGLITQYPWDIGTSELTVPSTHTSYQMVNDKNTWIRFSRPSDGIIPFGTNSGWTEKLIQSEGYSNDAYLAINGNIGQIQTGHTSGSATTSEQKVLANTLFYMTQLTTTTETNKTDDLSLDVNNPTNISVTGYEFLDNGSQVKFNYSTSNDVGTEYKYYVKATGSDDSADRLSNTTTNTITSGLKGYSYVVDSSPTTVPDSVVDTTSTSITIDNNKGNNIYLHVKAVDNAGNVSETYHYQLSDTTNPTISITGNPTSWTNQNVTLNVTGNDVGYGVKHIVLPNGNIVTGSTTSYTVSDNGNYTFKVVDKMGNETSQTIAVNKIDKSINTLNGVNQTMSIVNATTSTRKMTFTFNPVADNLSGVKGYSYVIDKNSTTIPDNNINTTVTTITKDITDTGVYYLHIKAIDNAGNISNVVHHKVDVANLSATVNTTDNMIRLDWSMNDLNNKTFKVYQKKPGNNEFQSIGATNFDTTTQVKVLNVYPSAGSSITFTTWDGENVTTDLSGSLKKWMEVPNAENPKGYGKGLIEVTPVKFTDFNANPSNYLTKDSNGKWNYDVVFVGAYDCNGNCTLQGRFDTTTVNYITNYVDEGYGLLIGHDFQSLKDRLKSGESSGVGAVASDLIRINKKGIMTSYPWNLGEIGDILNIPYSHNNGDMVDGDVWFKYEENTNTTHCKSWCNIEVQTQKSTNNHYLVTKNNLGMIQTGHSNGSATPDEQKILANTLFYLKQLSTDNYLDDYSGQDVTAPNKPVISGYSFTEDGYIKLNFNAVTDNGSEYSYYVESQTRDNDSLTLSNVVTETITSGMKGYSYVVDSNANTIPDNEIEQSTNETIKIKTNNSDELYVHIKAIDNVGNGSETYHYRITDVTPPTITITKNPSTWTNGSVTLTATATDSGSGVKYMILPNGNKVSASSVSYTVDKNGIYYFRAIDYMGNEASTSIIVNNIDKKIPTVTITNNQNWTNQDVQVNINATDE